MLNNVKRLIHLGIDLVSLPAGWLVYTLTGRTPYWAGMSLIRMFCASGGRSNDLMARLISWRHPGRDIGAAKSILVERSPAEVERAAADLRTRGYHLFKDRVPADVCDRLLQFAMTQPAKMRAAEGGPPRPGTVRYDPANPKAVRYEYEERDLINHPDVQLLMSDPALLALAQSYLGAQPIADVVYMWWHTAFSDQPDGEAAQLYHFDMDRVKWVKFFIYLTDVASENGPHYFIAGSHRTDGIPSELLSRGYVRLRDEEVAPHYPAQDIIEFAGPRGTVLAEDTRGLHKGQHVHHGHRLVLQIQFSNSRFGPAYPPVAFDAMHHAQLAELARRHPRIYSAYLPAHARA
jgi:hypothetical protein